MSFNKNLLKNLLANLLDDRLKRLEKRNIEEIKDLKYAKIQYNNLNSILKKIIIKKDTKNNKNKNSYNNSLNNKSELLKHNENKNFAKFKFSPNYNKKTYNIRRAKTPSKNDTKYWFTAENWTKKKNNKYNYVKSRYMDETNNISKSKVRKLFLTPEAPKIKRKKKLVNQNKINIVTKNLNLDKINNKKKNFKITKKMKMKMKMRKQILKIKV